MVQFAAKRLQVFVSSTFTDLVKERQAAVEAILTAGHIPAGMELFTSGDESQMDAIKQWIDESDVYMLILGGRYGSIEPTSGKSYTQIEYEYALDRNKPLFGCVVTNDALERRVRESGTGVLETEHPQELKVFRNLALSKLVRFWEDSKDIKIAVGETLSHFVRREDLRGWVRQQDQANVPFLADEIARLSKENSELRQQLSQASQRLLIRGVDFDDLSQYLRDHRLLDTLLDGRSVILGGTFRAKQVSKTDEELEFLVELGFLKRDNTRPYDYIVTEDCRLYLSKLLVVSSKNE